MTKSNGRPLRSVVIKTLVLTHILVAAIVFAEVLLTGGPLWLAVAIFLGAVLFGSPVVLLFIKLYRRYH